MRVRISVDNGDQEVEVTRSTVDIMWGDGRIVHGGEALARILDLAVTDVRRACELGDNS